MHEEAIDNAKTESFEAGVESEKIEIAKEMLKENESLDKIAKFTKLTIKEIKKLKESI